MKGKQRTYDVGDQPGDRPLAAPPVQADRSEFGRDDLGAVRALAAEAAGRAGFAGERVDDLKVVANELASNAIKHGRSPRTIALWPEAGRLLCQVTSRGAIRDPLAGRRKPILGDGHGMGLWIVHQLSELVEVSTGEQTTVRAHLSAD